MSLKSLIGTLGFTFIIIIIGIYFLIQKEKGSIKIVSYSSSSQEKPRVKVEESSSDFGKIKVSEKIEKEFIIKNVGTKPLQLFNISSNCGCTAGQILYRDKVSKEFGMHAQGDFEEEILPQTEAKLRVVYRPFVMPVYGQVVREVYLSTNDPDTPKLVFTIKAFVD